MEGDSTEGKLSGSLGFVELVSFTRAWFDFGEDDESLSLLEAEILEDPEKGDLVKEAHGLRKIRAASARRNSGKSGGLRVFYFLRASSNEVFLIGVLDKKDAQNLTKKERQAMGRYILDNLK